MLCAITSQLKDTYICLTRKHQEEIEYNTTYKQKRKLFLGNTQQISDIKGRKRDAKQEKKKKCHYVYK